MVELYGGAGARKKHFPHRIVLSNNMLKQGFIVPQKTFKSYQLAYNYGIGKWGSGSFDSWNLQMGWAIEYFEDGKWKSAR